MGFNRRRLNDELRRGSEKAAAVRRALSPQFKADAVRLIDEWNERQAQCAPLLFSPTIGAAIAAHALVSVGPVPNLLHDEGARLAPA
jgi:hypothetical protein